LAPSLDRLRERELKGVLELRPGAAQPEGTLHFLSTDEESRQLRERLRLAFEDVRRRERDRLVHEVGIAQDPAAWTWNETALASPERLRASQLAVFLPLVLVLVLLSGASFAAIDAFAGERERGTLETLLVHPVPAAAITAGKFLAVWLVGLSCVALNLASLLVCYRLGWLGASGGALELPPLGAWAVLIVQLLLLSLLLTCALVVVAARARSFREGQNYVLPLTLFALLPTGLATLPAVKLTALTGLVPLLGPSLAVREAFAGRALGLGAAVAALSTAVFVVALLRGVARALDAERVLREVAPRLESDRAGVPGRRAMAVALLAFFVHAWGSVQIGSEASGGPYLQLAFSLALVLPLATFFATRRATLAWSEALPFGAPRSTRAWFALPCLAVGALGFSLLAWRVQAALHPDAGAPSDVELGGSALLRFAFLALLPALAEEAFFRGPLLAATTRGGRVVAGLASSAAFFALFHMSLARFLPTFGLGLVLGGARLATGTLWIPIAIHAFHNGCLVALSLQDDPDGLLAILQAQSPWLVLGLPLGALLLRRRAADTSS
ncbi:MAG: CPBP family intramembrane metalloprotease, partial [Planctomycetes bacterium]|nr:CPBP family intramembrane metalloprotease [Planctomycetota bacterium]